MIVIDPSFFEKQTIMKPIIGDRKRLKRKAKRNPISRVDPNQPTRRLNTINPIIIRGQLIRF